MTVIYNEIDPFASQWLGNLVDAGQIAKGQVITKSIAELTKEDLAGSAQVHLFAGIGGWPLALKLSGWPENMPVWTGSCPCQPFSVAGKKKGNEDERHLWPEMFRLIKECKPPVIFGEQVASPDGIDWMQAVQNDLEAQGYEVGKLDLCAAGFHAFHIRQRIFWTAVSTEWLADTDHKHQRSAGTRERFRESWGDGEISGMADTKSTRAGENKSGLWLEYRNGGTTSGMADTGLLGQKKSEQQTVGNIQLRTDNGTNPHNPWANPDWIGCRDNKFRPVESGSTPLAYGLPRSLGEGGTREERMGLLAAKRSRKGQLKGYGNAIVPQVGAMFIKSVMEWIGLKEVEECK